MSNALFGQGRNGFLTKSMSWTADTIKAMLIDIATDDAANLLVTAATNASPIVLTTGSQSWSVGDIVVVGGVLGNTCANGTWKISARTSTTVTLQTLAGVNSTGNAAYTSGGYIVNLSSPQFVSDLNASRVGTDVALTGLSAALGVANSSAFTWTSVASQANSVKAVVLYDATPGSDATNPLIAFYDGKTQVVVAADTANAAVTTPVQPLTAAIPSGTVLRFSGGSSLTMTAPGAVGDKTISGTVAASPTLFAGETSDATTTNAGLPVTPNGGNIQFTPDTGANKLFSL